MPLREDETKLLETLSLDVAWPLVETFATIPREAPADCDRAAGLIVDALREAGVPVTIHEPELYLALPRHGSVRLGGATLFAKPSPFTASRPDGVTARLVHVRGAAALPHGFSPASAALFGADFDWKLADRVTFTQDANAVTETGSEVLILVDGANTTINLLSGIDFKINDRLRSRLSYQLEHDSNPGPNAESTDTQTRFTLVYGF